jgi:hypothetical protein
MPNPWLTVPLDDYEGHMSSDGVAQLSVLAELFAEALARCRSSAVAILGIPGGNGLSHMDGAITKRIIGLDVNPSYWYAIRQRDAELAGLELHCVDLSKPVASLEPVALVHAALVFEHTEASQCLENALSLVAPGGALSVVLQLPSEIDAGPSPFLSMQNLADQFTLIDPAWLRDQLDQRGFRLEQETRRALPSGKAFWTGFFRPS